MVIVEALVPMKLVDLVDLVVMVVAIRTAVM